MEKHLHWQAAALPSVLCKTEKLINLYDP